MAKIHFIKKKRKEKKKKKKKKGLPSHPVCPSLNIVGLLVPILILVVLFLRLKRGHEDINSKLPQLKGETSSNSGCNQRNFYEFKWEVEYLNNHTYCVAAWSKGRNT